MDFHCYDKFIPFLSSLPSLLFSLDVSSTFPFLTSRALNPAMGTAFTIMSKQGFGYGDNCERPLNVESLFYPSAARSFSPFLPRCIECRAVTGESCPSVCMCVKRVHCDKREERSIQIFMPYETAFSLFF